MEITRVTKRDVRDVMSHVEFGCKIAVGLGHQVTFRLIRARIRLVLPCYGLYEARIRGERSEPKKIFVEILRATRITIVIHVICVHQSVNAV